MSSGNLKAFQERIAQDEPDVDEKEVDNFLSSLKEDKHFDIRNSTLYFLLSNYPDKKIVLGRKQSLVVASGIFSMESNRLFKTESVYLLFKRLVSSIIGSNYITTKLSVDRSACMNTKIKERIRIFNDIISEITNITDNDKQLMEVYGSGLSGLATDNSDVDIAIQMSTADIVELIPFLKRSSENASASWERDCKVEILKRFRRQVSKVAFVKEVLPIYSARVPLLRLMVDDGQCDITVSSNLCVRNSMLLRTYSEIDIRAKELIHFVKRWAKTTGIGDASVGGFSSYSWCLMVIYFLQRRPFGNAILPCLTSPPETFGLSLEKTFTELASGSLLDTTFYNPPSADESKPLPETSAGLAGTPFTLRNCSPMAFHGEREPSVENGGVRTEQLLVEFFIFYVFVFDRFNLHVDISVPKGEEYNFEKYSAKYPNREFRKDLRMSKKDSMTIQDPFEDSRVLSCYGPGIVCVYRNLFNAAILCLASPIIKGDIFKLLVGAGVNEKTIDIKNTLISMIKLSMETPESTIFTDLYRELIDILPDFQGGQASLFSMKTLSELQEIASKSDSDFKPARSTMKTRAQVEQRNEERRKRFILRQSERNERREQAFSVDNNDIREVALSDYILKPKLSKHVVEKNEVNVSQNIPKTAPAHPTVLSSSTPTHQQVSSNDLTNVEQVTKPPSRRERRLHRQQAAAVSPLEVENSRPKSNANEQIKVEPIIARVAEAPKPAFPRSYDRNGELIKTEGRNNKSKNTGKSAEVPLAVQPEVIIPKPQSNQRQKRNKAPVLIPASQVASAAANSQSAEGKKNRNGEGYNAPNPAQNSRKSTKKWTASL